MRPSSGSGLSCPRPRDSSTAHQAAGKRGGHLTAGILWGQELMGVALHPQESWCASAARARAWVSWLTLQRPPRLQEKKTHWSSRAAGPLGLLPGDQHRQKTRVCRSPSPEPHKAKKLGSGARPEGRSSSWPRTSPIPQGPPWWHQSSQTVQILTTKASTVYE